MDENDSEISQAITRVAAEVPGVIGVDDVRTRWLGRQAEARLRVRVPVDTEFADVHAVAHRVQDAVRRDVPDVREVVVEPVPATLARRQDG